MEDGGGDENKSAIVKYSQKEKKRKSLVCTVRSQIALLCRSTSSRGAACQTTTSRPRRGETRGSRAERQCGSDERKMEASE